MIDDQLVIVGAMLSLNSVIELRCVRNATAYACSRWLKTYGQRVSSERSDRSFASFAVTNYGG